MKLSVALIAIVEFAAATTRPLNDLAQDPIITAKQKDGLAQKSAKILHLVRHGQAYNNLGHYDWLDPNLTDKGVEQARGRGEHWPKSDTLDLIVASPMLRAMNTTLNLVDMLSKRNISLPNFSTKPIIALPELEELGSSPSSRGHLRKDLEDILGRPPQFPIDFNLLTPDWNSTTGYWNRSESASIVRAEKVRQWLYEREEQRIMVVGHDAMLKLVVNSSCFRDHVGLCQGWNNAQVRHFHIEMSAERNPTLVEIDEQRAKGSLS